MTFSAIIKQHLDAGVAGLWISSYEEARVLPEIEAVVKDGFHRFYWSAASGLRSSTTPDEPVVPPTAPLAATLGWLREGAKKPWVVILADPHHVLEQKTRDAAAAIRAVREIITTKSGVVCIISPRTEMPDDWNTDVVRLPFCRPSHDQLMVLAQDVYKTAKAKSLTPLADASLGLTQQEAQTQLLLAKTLHKNVLQPAADQIWNYRKAQCVDMGLVDIGPPRDQWKEFGGYYEFRKWLDRMAPILLERPQHIPRPKCVLLVGPYGVGKSQLTRTIAARLGWWRVTWDLGRVYNQFVGASEHRMDQLLDTTEQFRSRGVVVEIDEIAYQMAGFESSGSTDSGVTSRITQKFLTWSAERTGDGILMVGSTNEPWKLPPPLVRSGRTDKIFYLGPPGEDALADILTIHLRRYKAELSEEDSTVLVKRMKGKQFVGAEVEQTVVEAVQQAYPHPPERRHFEQAVLHIIPAAVTMAEQIKRLEEWARTRAVPA